MDWQAFQVLRATTGPARRLNLTTLTLGAVRRSRSERRTAPVRRSRARTCRRSHGRPGAQNPSVLPKRPVSGEPSDLPLLEALQEKFCDALLPLAATNLRRRDAVLPAVPRKTHVVIGMRRAERTCFLKQLLAEWRLICGDDALQDPRG